MDKRILAIFDGEESYAYRLMEFISEKRNLPFRVYVFTDKKKFYSCAKTEDIEIGRASCRERVLKQV